MAKRPPNLVYVFPDQMRGQAIGIRGEDPVITPRLDAFAKESLDLPQAVSNYPVCSPYRAILMTGQASYHNGVVSNCTNRTAPYGCELRADATCWSDVLARHGYSLGYIGKWHLDSPQEPWIPTSNNQGDTKWNEWCPPERRHGFDYWYAYGTYDMHLRPMYWETHADRDGWNYVDQWGPEHETDRAIAYLENADGSYRDPDAPFALVVSMNPPHMPYYQVPQRYLDRYADADPEALLTRPSVPQAGTKWGDYARENIRGYYAMVTGVDEQFGRILDCLAAQGLADDTIVVFTSDHGDCLGENEHQAKNNPYEPSMRVPFMIRWPGQIAPRQDDLLLSSWDIYPTLLDLLGVAADIPDAVDGVSHADLMRTGDGARPSSQLYMWMPTDAPQHGRRGVRTPQYTLIWERDATDPDAPPRRTLYDRIADPYQMHNIAADHPAICDNLAATELVPWLERLRDPWLRSDDDGKGA